MKKFLTNTVTLAGAAIISVERSFAAIGSSGLGSVSGLSTSADIQSAIAQLINSVLNVILIVAVAFVIIAGIRLIVSGGDEGEKDKAKMTIIYVGAGMIIILLARVIVTFVNNLL